jgi:hypothetical protein
VRLVENVILFRSDYDGPVCERDKYRHTKEDTIMDTTDDQEDEGYDGIEEQREIIRHSLHEIVNDIGMAMRDAGLHFPVFMTVRDSGDSLATIATLLDPSDQDWQRASAIVCQIMEQRIGGGRLRGQELVCAVANSPPMSAAEVAPS